MTNAELIQKIRAEIERLMDEYKPIVGGVDETTGAHIVLAKLLSFLSTLEESEKPMEGLEDDLTNEADKMFFSLGFYEGDHHQPMLDCISLEQFRGIARHFAKWQKEQDTREMVMSDGSYFQNCYELGKKDMKEQMLKEAVEGEVVKDISNKLAVTAKINLDGFKFGDKVRIIICKKED